MAGRKTGGEIGGDAGPEAADTALAAGEAAPAKPRKPRRKGTPAAKTMAQAEALSAAGAAALAELAGLQRLVGQLVQGLTAMQDAQSTHTEMLRALLTAVATPAEPEHEVARLLEQVVGVLGNQSGQLRVIGAALTRLPAEVGAVVAREIGAAMAQVR